VGKFAKRYSKEREDLEEPTDARITLGKGLNRRGRVWRETWRCIRLGE